MTDIVGSPRIAMKVGDLALGSGLRSLHQRELKLAKEHNGKIIKTSGDGSLAVFAHATEAMEFALALQELFSNESIAGDEKLSLRIGVHSGTVTMVNTPYGEDVFGSNVNLVARLENLAQPGEILVSREASEQLDLDGRRFVSSREVGQLKGFGQVEFSRVRPAV
jgi:adenylate cyclase